jgi:hypothetical protein
MAFSQSQSLLEVAPTELSSPKVLRNEKTIYTYIQRMDYRKLKNHLNYLASSSDGQTGTTGTMVDITQIYDRKGYTPIHFAAFQNSLKSLQILCEHILKHSQGPQTPQQQLREWLNS